MLKFQCKEQAGKILVEVDDGAL